MPYTNRYKEINQWHYQKKGIRKITVNDFCYGWSATGNDGWISLTIALLTNGGQILTTSFDYHSKVVQKGVTKNDVKWQKIQQQLIITPNIVRQVIEYGLKKWLESNGKRTAI